MAVELYKFLKKKVGFYKLNRKGTKKELGKNQVLIDNLIIKKCKRRHTNMSTPFSIAKHKIRYHAPG